MIKAVIFDLDGTLLNTLDGLKDSTNFALRQFGYEEKSIEQIRSYVGNGVEKLIMRALPQGVNKPDFENCLETFKLDYSKNMYKKTVPYAGIIEMLKVLKAKNIKTGVVSNKFDAAVKELCKKYFGELIDIAEGEGPQTRPKPCPDGVLKVMKCLDVKNNEVLYVGDSDVDVCTANNANIECIGVTWGFRDKKVLIDSGATKIINTPQEIFKYL